MSCPSARVEFPLPSKLTLSRRDSSRPLVQFKSAWQRNNTFSSSARQASAASSSSATSCRSQHPPSRNSPSSSEPHPNYPLNSLKAPLSTSSKANSPPPPPSTTLCPPALRPLCPFWAPTSASRTSSYAAPSPRRLRTPCRSSSTRCASTASRES